MKKRVAIGMSGGVDSSAAAKLLLDQGYEVIGFFMKLWHDPTCSVSRENACCDEKSLADARTIADLLGIKFYVVDAREKFRQSVVEYFINEYKNFRTPNPCVVCNEKIKFGWLLEYASKLNCDYLATGHYARIVGSRKPEAGSKKSPNNQNVETHLLKGKDESKDQSYFLYRLKQKQLAKILFPVGEYTKPEVREMAKKWKLPVHEKMESQEICFIQNEDYRSFLRRQIPETYFNPGEIVDKEGNIVGRHEGLINYTIGQRRGITQDTITKKQDTKPLYVIGFNSKKNQLIVGKESDLYKSEAIIDDLSWTNPKHEFLVGNIDTLKVKIRYRAKEVPCSVRSLKPEAGSKDTLGIKGQTSSQIAVLFKEPQKAITPGQSAVFYRGEEVLGGGIIV